MIADVTVCIPTIPPREELLHRALRSVYAQTVEPHDIVTAVDMLKEGAAATRQRALDAVETTWVAFLDDDDELYPKHLESLLQTAEATGADLVYPWFSVVGGTDPLAVPVNGALRSPFGVPFGPEQATHLLTEANFIPITFLARTETVRVAGGFRKPRAGEWHSPDGQNEDWDLLMRMLKFGAKFVHHPERTWIWHHDSGNTSGLPERW